VLDERVTVTFQELTQLCGSDAEVVRLLVARVMLRPSALARRSGASAALRSGGHAGRFACRRDWT